MKNLLKTFSAAICIIQILSSQFLPKSIGLEKNEEVHWAVLVAGSNSFWNYRHQSDIFHAYQTLIKRGLSPNNIILLAYDDIANSSENPFKGKVFNKPDPNGEGEDVYKNIKIDYSGEDVNPENFLNVITGNKKGIKGGNGRVLESASTDNVFIYFSDHGAVGLIAFPNGELYADHLNNAFIKMHENKMYNKLVFYLEACESGSMFENILKKDIGIYATTAADPNESSWATYCYPHDKVNGKSIGSCLGDEYSVNWIENAENNIVSNSNTDNEESLSEQYKIIKEKTTDSAVQKYGDFSYLNETINDFEGFEEKKEESFLEKNIEFLTLRICEVREFIGIPCAEDKKNKDNYYKDYLEIAKKSVVDSRKAKVDYLLRKSQTSNDPKYGEMLKMELEHMENTNKIFDDFNIVFDVNRKENILNIEFDCVRNSINSYKKCAEFGEYDLIFVRNIAAACNKHKSEEVVQFFKNLC